MIKHILRNLRQQPKGVRDNIALGIAVVFTSMVAIGWLYSLPMKVPTQTESIAGEKQPGFTALFSGIKSQLAGIGEADTGQETVSTTKSDFIDSDYQVVMPDGDVTPKTSFFASSSTSTATTTTDSEVASSTTTSTTTSGLRPIRIVTTNDIPATSTATSSH